MKRREKSLLCEKIRRRRRDTREEGRQMKILEGNGRERGVFSWLSKLRGKRGARLVFGERLEIHILDLFYENGLLDNKLYVGARRLVRWNN